MKRDAKIHKLSKKLVALSKDEKGVVTESKVTDVLSGLKKAEIRHYLSVLKTYLKLLRREVALQTAVVSTPGELSESALEEIAAKYSKLYGRSIQATTATDDSLIAGVRVRVGDDVFDASIAGRLQRLAESVH